jgi:hypothetical protein
MELADFNHVNQKYLDIKLEMIKEEKLPFQVDDFFDAQAEGLTRRSTIGPSQKLQD